MLAWRVSASPGRGRGVWPRSFGWSPPGEAPRHDPVVPPIPMRDASCVRTCMSGAVHIIERDLTRERTRAGLDAARRRGRVGGRRTVLTPAKERQARRMLAEGATKDEVAGVVGVSISTLYRRLDSGVSRVGK